jgi:hypothetical protein
MVVQVLVEFKLRLPHVRFYILNHPEVDIRDAQQALAIHDVPLQVHGQAGQNRDIFSDYIKSVVYSDLRVKDVAMAGKK